MSSVLARYEVSGERRKPKPSGSTSSVPSPKIVSPVFARFLRMANINSCLRRRFAFSISRPFAISINAETCCDFSSDKCIQESCQGEMCYELGREETLEKAFEDVFGKD